MVLLPSHLPILCDHVQSESEVGLHVSRWPVITGESNTWSVLKVFSHSCINCYFGNSVQFWHFNSCKGPWVLQMVSVIHPFPEIFMSLCIHDCPRKIQTDEVFRKPKIKLQLYITLGIIFGQGLEDGSHAFPFPFAFSFPFAMLGSLCWRSWKKNKIVY